MRPKYGFTLIEMMIALAMSAILVTPLYVITRGISEQTDMRRMEIETMQRGRTGLDMIIRDFTRAGLYTSPNTVRDKRFLNSGLDRSSVRFRSAVMHLNRGVAGNDAVLLTGNFLGSLTYQAYAIDALTLRFIDPVAGPADCLDQFNATYGYVHVVDSKGADIEAKVHDSEQTGDETTCTVSIEESDSSAQSFKGGDLVRVSANQTLLYKVDGTSLVRYFVDYRSPTTSSGGVCTADAVPGDIIVASRRVVADFVTDFQVWFRPVTADNSGRGQPHYHSITDLDLQKGANFKDGFLLPAEWHYIPQSPGESVVSVDSISCNALEKSASIGPERVRSAIVRLTVRSEASDPALRWASYTDNTARIIRYSVAQDPSSGATAANQPAFRLKTLVTEIEMPNLAARADLLAAP